MQGERGSAAARGAEAKDMPKMQWPRLDQGAAGAVAFNHRLSGLRACSTFPQHLPQFGLLGCGEGTGVLLKQTFHSVEVRSLHDASGGVHTRKLSHLIAG